MRAARARPDGPAALVEWADSFVRRTGPAVQVKTWNLSCLYRLPTADGPVWAKAVPPFAAAEATAMSLVAAHDATLVPQVPAAEASRLLLGHVPGEDCWEPSAELIRSLVPRLVAVQAAPRPVLDHVWVRA